MDSLFVFPSKQVLERSSNVLDHTVLLGGVTVERCAVIHTHLWQRPHLGSRFVSLFYAFF